MAENETLYRFFKIDRESINKDARTVDLSCASDTPVERWGGFEILTISAQAIDFGRLSNGAPLLLNHDTDEQPGVIDRAYIQDGKLRVVARFSKSPLGEEIFQDVIDGIRPNVSIGYIVNERSEDQKDGVSTFRVTSWEPLEVSIVAVPADPTVGVGRAARVDTSAKAMSTPAAPAAEPAAPSAPAAPVVAVISETEKRNLSTSAKNEVREVLSIARRAGFTDAEADKFIEDGKSVEQVRTLAFDKVIERGSAGAKTPIAAPTMDAKDVSKYSIVRAALAIAQGRNLEGIEKECEEEMDKRAAGNPLLQKSSPFSFRVPHEVMGKRTLTAADNDQAGYAVPTELRGVIELLRNKTTVIAAGATVISGLTSNIDFLRQKTAATPANKGETEAASSSDMAVERVSLTPNRLVSKTGFSRQLNFQSAFAIEPLIRDDISKQQAIAIDAQAFFGTGTSGQPLGIINTAGIDSSVTFSGAATWANVVKFEGAVEAGNALMGALAYIISPATKSKWKTIAKATNYPEFLIDRDGSANGYPVLSTNQLTAAFLKDGVTSAANRAFFGNWADLLIGFFDGTQVLVDPYTSKANDIVELQVTQYYDMLLRHVASFSVSTDSAAQ